jgi:formylglycine-generating enzyme required for sulfatase activity
MPPPFSENPLFCMANGGYWYRLPTEAEWEYACRGGATSEEDCSYHFYFDKPTNDLSLKQANFQGARTTRVGAYPPNKLGLFDMHGNVWQWCADALGPDRVCRGGSWGDLALGCRAAFRGAGTPTYRYMNHGVRLVRVRVPS